MANDFRGYVQSTAPEFLGFVGNDGGYNAPKLQSAGGVESNYKHQSLTPQGAVNAIGELWNNYNHRYDAAPSGGQAAPSGGSAAGGGGGRASGPAYNPADLAYLDSQTGTLQRMLQSADTGLNNGLTNLGDSFNKESSNVNQQRSRALEDYGKQEVLSQQGKDQSLGKVDTNARTLNDSLRRILGMAAGSGSSAYLTAPKAVARQASGQREGVLSDYATNADALHTAEERAKTDFQSLLDNLWAQKNQKESDLRSGVLNNKNSINQQLGSVAAQRSSLLGGSYKSAIAAQQPYAAAINANQGALDNLFNQFRSPTYNITPVNAKPVDLKQYAVDKAAINTNSQSGTQDAYSPYSFFLKKQQDQGAIA